MIKIIQGITLLCVGLLTGLSQTAKASDSGEWHYEITPYMLMAGMKGDVGLEGNTVDLNVAFDDILDDLNSGFMGLFTAQRGKWIFALEGVYMKLSDEAVNSVKGPFGQVSRNGELDITNKMYIAQATVGYQVLDDKTHLSVIGGLRYNKLEMDMDIDVNFTPPIANISGSASKKKNWTDGIVGLYMVHPLSEKLELTAYVDVGAGGSDLTYQFMGGVNWEFAKGYKAKLGYRHLYWDYEDGYFVWDVTAAGPYLGVGISF